MPKTLRPLLALAFILAPTHAMAGEVGGVIRVSGYVLGSCRSVTSATAARCSSPARVVTLAGRPQAAAPSASASRVQVTPIV